MKRLEQTRRGVRITTKDGFVITARRAVVAAGFESKALLKGEAGTLKSTYALISEPLPKIRGWHKQCLIWESGSPYLYLRTTTEGRVIVGGEDEDFANAKRRDALISQKTRTLVKKFGRFDRRRTHPGRSSRQSESRRPHLSLWSMRLPEEVRSCSTPGVLHRLNPGKRRRPGPSRRESRLRQHDR
jgi:glycine/D-amino acid oxidase-like deaminating enzyme